MFFYILIGIIVVYALAVNPDISTGPLINNFSNDDFAFIPKDSDLYDIFSAEFNANALSGTKFILLSGQHARISFHSTNISTWQWYLQDIIDSCTVSGIRCCRCVTNYRNKCVWWLRQCLRQKIKNCVVDKSSVVDDIST